MEMVGGGSFHGTPGCSLPSSSLIPTHLGLTSSGAWKFCENALALIASEGEDGKGRQQD